MKQYNVERYANGLFVERGAMSFASFGGGGSGGGGAAGRQAFFFATAAEFVAWLERDLGFAPAEFKAPGPPGGVCVSFVGGGGSGGSWGTIPKPRRKRVTKRKVKR